MWIIFYHILQNYGKTISYPIEVARNNIIAKGWFSSIYIELLKVSLMQFFIWAYRQLTIAS